MSGSKKAKPRKEPAERANPIEIEQRLYRVEELLAMGKPYGHITTALSKEYGVGIRAIEDYITKIYAKWREEHAGINIQEKRAKYVEMASRLYNQSNATISDKLRALDRMIALDGVAEPVKSEEKIEVTIRDYTNPK